MKATDAPAGEALDREILRQLIAGAIAELDLRRSSSPGA